MSTSPLSIFTNRTRKFVPPRSSARKLPVSENQIINVANDVSGTIWQYSRGVVGLNLVLSDKVFFSVDSGSLGHS